MYSKLMGLILLVCLTGCGGSDDNEGSRFINNGNSNTTEVIQNAALEANGASIKSASYDANAAKYTIDGSSSTYWAGNSSDENFIIGFSSTAELIRIDIKTNITTYSLAAPAIVLELSTNQRTWRVIMGASNDGGIQCTSWGLSSTTLSCILLNESARYLRITTNDSSVNIYEVDATGKMTVSAPAS